MPRSTHAFRGAQVLVLEDAQDHLTIEYQGRQLTHTRYQEQSRQAEVVPSKLIAPAVEAAQQKQAPTKPTDDHPWRHAPTLQSKKRPAGRASPGGQTPPAGGV